MKELLVLVSGSEKDTLVAGAALEIARPLSAHLRFLHIRQSLGEMALHMPHYGFAMGSAVAPAMEELKQRQDARAASARLHVETMCRDAVRSGEGEFRWASGLSANFEEGTGDRVVELVVRLARESDATVIGRHTDPDGMPEDLLEQILFEAGRPLIIAPDMAPSHSVQTIAIFWKDSPEVARAVTAAMPLLALATQVFVLSLPEEDGSSVDGLMALMKGLIDAGIKAEVKTLEAKGRAVSDALLSAAKEFCAELIVAGGYGHGRTREMIFGGCTRRFIESGDTPMFLVH